MSNDPMQDADSAENIQPPQESSEPSFSEIPGSTQAHTPTLPAYANPTFYATPQVEPVSPPIITEQAPSVSPRLSSHEQINYVRDLLPFWPMVRQFPRQYWRVLTKPNIVTFYYEKSKASWSGVWAQVVGFALLNALIASCILTITSFTTLTQPSPGHTPPPLPGLSPLQGSLTFGILAGILIMLVTIFGYFFQAGVFYLAARLFGGRGPFLDHCYCMALIIVPIDLISAALSYILLYVPSFSPRIASTIGLVTFVYGLILQVFMVMAVHRLSGFRSAAAVILAALLLAIGVLSFIPLPQ